MQVPGLGIEPLGAALEAFGYKLRDFYTFPRTHVLAAWYAPPADLYEQLPRMFISQLQVCRADLCRGPPTWGCKVHHKCVDLMFAGGLPHEVKVHARSDMTAK